ncbi:MAG: hypothetical protein MKZ95_16025, partial [Pirellulales bacterium]|nr:hypothetical protein [Pirellulales bacterium]
SADVGVTCRISAGPLLYQGPISATGPSASSNRLLCSSSVYPSTTLLQELVLTALAVHAPAF